MRIRKGIILTLLLTFVAISMVNAQISRTDYELNQKMKKALELMANEDYISANAVFRNILATEKVLPTNLSYHFSLTLYHIKQYRNSSNFLQKYLDLSGKGGDFYEQAIQLQGLLEEAFKQIEECQLCDINGYEFVTCSICQGERSIIETCSKCQGVGKVSCQKCKGEGVVITTDSFGDKKYQTCDRCAGKGLHTCHLCEGVKKLNLVCTACLGSGNESSKSICDHEASN